MRYLIGAVIGAIALGLLSQSGFGALLGAGAGAGIAHFFGGTSENNEG